MSDEKDQLVLMMGQKTGMSLTKFLADLHEANVPEEATKISAAAHTVVTAAENLWGRQSPDSPFIMEVDARAWEDLRRAVHDHQVAIQAAWRAAYAKAIAENPAVAEAQSRDHIVKEKGDAVIAAVADLFRGTGPFSPDNPTFAWAFKKLGDALKTYQRAKTL